MDSTLDDVCNSNSAALLPLQELVLEVEHPASLNTGNEDDGRVGGVN